jgi:hypothetical protein
MGKVSNQVFVCVYEDRADCMLGVKLLAKSALRHEPAWHLHTFLRNASSGDLAWLRSSSNVTVREEFTTAQTGWSVKPELITKMIHETQGPVMWCDSDILIARPISPAVSRIPRTTLVATQEYCWGRRRGSKSRTKGWEWDEARPLKTTVNTCWMRIDPSHIPLMQAWSQALSSPAYIKAQSSHWSTRPIHLVSDQDVFTALLATSRFANVPIHLLRNGVDIAQCFQKDGYTAHHRLFNAAMGRVPALIHAQGAKPWNLEKKDPDLAFSPYAVMASEYVASEGFSSEWLPPAEVSGGRLRTRLLRDPNLCALLPAVRQTLTRVTANLDKLCGRRKYV